MMIVRANDSFAEPLNWFTPRVSSVIGKAPVENAPLGLHYFAPSNIPIGVHDISRVLSCLIDNQVYAMAGMRSATALQQLGVFASLKTSTEHDRDVAYSHGYNPVVYFPGAGPVLYGSHIAGTALTLPSVLAVMRIVAGIGKIIRTTLQDSQMMLSGFVKHEFYYLQSQITEWIREFMIQRDIEHGDARIEDETLTVTLKPTPWGNPMVFSFGQYELQHWTPNAEFAEFVRVAVALYPAWFVDCGAQGTIFNDYILIEPK
jgi:hypothetical protein